MILNLSVNALDAMPEGGKLIVETSRVQVSQEYAKQNPGVVLGRYLKLDVSDTGTGWMKRRIRAFLSHSLQPKSVEKELVLDYLLFMESLNRAAVQISVSSRFSKGTTFHIYLLQVERPTNEPEEVVHENVLPTGSETILLVDDNESVRASVGAMLKDRSRRAQ
jgi:hypothetical protein